MSEASLAQAPARNTPATPLEVIASRIEEDLDRLRRARPVLDARIDRAARIIVVHLSSLPAARPIKCRVRRGGRRVLLVASLRSGGITYEVCPASWTCSCPDFHRQGTGCKRGIAAWALYRAALAVEVADHVERVEEINDRVQGGGCDACHGGWVYLDEDVIDPDSGEVGRVRNPVKCRSCKPATPPHLTDEELREWMDSAPWRFAKTMPRHPHFYSELGARPPEVAGSS